jgi:predicted phosphodiesterase
VESGAQTIAAAARSAGAEAALFGHTHVPQTCTLDGIFVLNPGSVSRPRSRIGPSFAVLECPATGPLTAQFYGLSTKGRHLAVRELKR